MARDESLKDRFIKLLIADIISGKYKIGDNLPSERELCDKFGISRTVVRAGLVEMATNRFIETHDRSGSVVLDYQRNASLSVLNAILDSGGNLSEELMRGFLEARALVERETAKLAARNRDDEALYQLYGILRRQYALSPGDVEALTETSFDFHHMVAEAGGNPIYPIFLTSMESTYKILLREYYGKGVTAGEIVPMHKKMYEAIFDRNEDAAVAMMDEILQYRV